MKKSFLASSILFMLYSCGGAGDDNATNNSAPSSNGNDSVGLTNPTAIDTIKHPTGMENSSVISTDTAAMNVQNTYKKADSIANAKGK